MQTGKRIPLDGAWKARGESVTTVIVSTEEPDLTYRRGNRNLPGMLFSSMLNPLIPYGLRGVIWYQGESNAASIEAAESYYAKLHTMIEDWRWHWGQGNFPFIQMILAGYRTPVSICTDDAWSVLRDVQIRLCRDMPSVYAASAIDIGEAEDIHPQNKKEAGMRMARIALAKVYHINGIVPSGPRLQKCAMEAECIRLDFENSDGLAFRGGNAKGFFLKNGAGKLLPPVSVTFENNALLLNYSSDFSPKELYYSWADNPDGNLVNRNF